LPLAHRHVIVETDGRSAHDVATEVMQCLGLKGTDG
jgi:hypothetical protein